MERRRARRRRVRLRVRVEPGNILSSTGDVGPGGVFIYAARLHRPGTRVRLTVHLPGGHRAWAEGVVRWAKRVPPALLATARGGMGVALERMDPVLARYLEGLFERKQAHR